MITSLLKHPNKCAWAPSILVLSVFLHVVGKALCLSLLCCVRMRRDFWCPQFRALAERPLARWNHSHFTTTNHSAGWNILLVIFGYPYPMFGRISGRWKGCFDPHFVRLFFFAWLFRISTSLSLYLLLFFLTPFSPPHEWILFSILCSSWCLSQWLCVIHSLDFFASCFLSSTIYWHYSLTSFLPWHPFSSSIEPCLFMVNDIIQLASNMTAIYILLVSGEVRLSDTLLQMIFSHWGPWLG